MKYVSIILLFFVFQNSYSTHLLGGDISYKHIGYDSVTNKNIYEIDFSVYAECNDPFGAELSDFMFTYYSLGAPLNYGSLVIGGGAYFVMDTVNLNDTIQDSEHWHWLIEKDTLDLSAIHSDPCLTIPDFCVTRGHYVDTIQLPVTNDTLYISTWDAALSFSLNNVDFGGAALNPVSMVLYATIPPANINSEPSCFDFVEDPKPLLCLNERQTLSFEVTDIGQASTVYEFITPTHCESQPSFTMVTYLSEPVNFLAPYTFDDPFNLGDSIWIDPSTGDISLRPNNLGIYYFDFLVSAYDSLGNLICSMNRPFSYTVTDCSRLAADPTITEPECGEKTVEFESISVAGATYLWDFGDGSTSNLPDINHTYASFGSYSGYFVISRNGACNDTATFDIDIDSSYQVEIDVNKIQQCIQGNSFDFGLQYDGLGGKTATSEMYFGPNANMASSSLVFQNGVVFNTVGTHEVYVQADVDGCKRYDTIHVEVVASPTADFSVSSLEVNIDEKFTVQNLASNYDSLFYVFNGDTIYSENFERFVEDLGEGEYSLTQYVFLNDNDLCFDKKTVTITVLDYYWIKIPNTITPNGDGLNEYLIPKYRNVTGFRYMIANRWGEIIFKQSEYSLENKWFGFKDNGEKVQAGTYVLFVEYFDYKHNYHIYKDVINVIY
ncbi:MAG: gliding motility-associated C-terminal domain-containing protein [Flavobacteriales bacterium]